MPLYIKAELQVSHNTSCFVCVVKDTKTGQFMPSCAALATDGMIVESELEEVQSMRQMALNLLLSEHTGDCEAPCAVVGGRRAAMGIISYFNNEKYKESYIINVSRGHWQSLHPDDLVYLRDIRKSDRQKMHFIPLEERKKTFKEVTNSFTVEEIATEGERCYECSCTAKTDCRLKDFSEMYNAYPETIKGEKLRYDFDTCHPAIILDRNKCIKCGICVNLC